MKKAMVISFLICIFATPVFAQQGYCKSFTLSAANPNQTILTVSPNQYFVLRKIYADGSGRWSLIANDNFSLNNLGPYVYDFPDKCAIAKSNDTIEILLATDSSIEIILIGYFDRVPKILRVPTLQPDLNSDGKVNWHDFSILAEHWLEKETGFVPQPPPKKL